MLIVPVYAWSTAGPPGNSEMFIFRYTCDKNRQGFTEAVDLGYEMPPHLYSLKSLLEPL